MIQRTQYLQPVARSPLKWTGKKAEQRMREWGIENEMVTGPESIQILSDVIV